MPPQCTLQNKTKLGISLNWKDSWLKIKWPACILVLITLNMAIMKVIISPTVKFPPTFHSRYRCTAQTQRCTLINLRGLKLLQIFSAMHKARQQVKTHRALTTQPNEFQLKPLNLCGFCLDFIFSGGFWSLLFVGFSSKYLPEAYRCIKDTPLYLKNKKVKAV